MRSSEIEQFLSDNHLSDATLKWLGADASTRRYARLSKGNKTYILMDSPLSEKPDQFYIVDQLLIKNGLSAPKIYSADLKKGLILMEDFGDNLYVNCIQKHPDREKSLYHQAIDTLVSLSKISCFDHIPKYDFSVCWQGISVFLDWYFGAFLGKPVSEPARTDFKAIWQNLFTRLNTAPKGLLLFDYQIYNLMDLPNRQGGQKCGILDFQDA